MRVGACVELGLWESRSLALACLQACQVFCVTRRIEKAGDLVAEVAVLRRVPYAVYFRVAGDVVVVVAVHGRQHPSQWQGRSQR